MQNHGCPVVLFLFFSIPIFCQLCYNMKTYVYIKILRAEVWYGFYEIEL